MNTSLHHGSAKIYQFPVRPRPGGPRRAEIAAAIEVEAPGIGEIDCGGAWYHEAAIQESKRPGEH